MLLFRQEGECRTLNIYVLPVYFRQFLQKVDSWKNERVYSERWKCDKNLYYIAINSIQFNSIRLFISIIIKTNTLWDQHSKKKYWWGERGLQKAKAWKGVKPPGYNKYNTCIWRSEQIFEWSKVKNSLKLNIIYRKI